MLDSQHHRYFAILASLPMTATAGIFSPPLLLLHRRNKMMKDLRRASTGWSAERKEKKKRESK
jgi:hypothetical protein